MVLPWFLIPGRPYPVQVYLYACDQYATNPSLGQRDAAEATRIKFKLETFSHTTLCRSFRVLEDSRKRALGNRFGDELKVCADESPPPVITSKNGADRSQKGSQGKRRFPSVGDTAGRRKEMAGFLRAFHAAAENGGIEAAGLLFAKYWHETFKRLLL